jgi:EpsD family peptidyl-prolyl cis-trans isomerase
MFARSVVKSKASICVVAAVALLGCSSDSESSKKGPSLVAVKVNTDELSVPQVNAQLMKLPNVAPEQQQATRKKVVEQLVDQQLLVQQAKEKKLDRDPEVLSALESARAQVLAEAYLQKSLFKSASPSDTEIEKYFNDNPALFAQRRVYRIQELATDLPADKVPELKQIVAKSSSLAEVDKWLKSKEAKTAINAAVRPAEALPLAQLPAISALKDGELTLLNNGKQTTVLHLLQSQSQPVDLERAKPIIKQFLGAQKREEIAKADIARLRKEAKIEYVGEFQQLMSVTAQASAPAASASSEVASPMAAAPESAATSASAAGRLDKGLAGLR